MQKHTHYVLFLLDDAPKFWSTEVELAKKKKRITNFLCTDILMGKAFVHAYEYTKYKWKHAFTMENTTFQTSLPTSLNALKHIFI